MSLEYWREYRTYFHIAQTWGVNESTVYRIIRKVEDELSKSGTFSLAGKKHLLNLENDLKTVVVDVTESPIERPKKNNNNITVEKRRSRHLNPR
jgi:Helix-turn-helix of DDE superfamily endonuclease